MIHFNNFNMKTIKIIQPTVGDKIINNLHFSIHL